MAMTWVGHARWMAHVYVVYLQLSLKGPPTHPTLGLQHHFDVSIDFIVFIMKPRCPLLPLGFLRRWFGRWCEVLYTHRDDLICEGGLR